MGEKRRKNAAVFSDDALDVPEMSFLKLKVVYTAASTFYPKLPNHNKFQ